MWIVGTLNNKKGVFVMKKLISLFITASVAAASLTSMSSAESTTATDTTVIYDILEYTIVNDTLIELSGCTDKTVTSVNIPAEIDGRAVIAGASVFSECPELIEIIVDDDNSCIEDIDGVLFEKNSRILLDYPRGLSGEYTIPDGTKIIDDKAFENASELTFVSLPDSLEIIGMSSFRNCTSLTGFSKPLPITYGGSISGCTALKAIEIAEAEAGTILTNLKFIDCPALESVIIPDCYLLNESFILRNCPMITEIQLPENSLLSSVNISGCESITSLDFTGLYIETINISDLPSLENISIDSSDPLDAGTTSLDIKDCENLKSLDLTGVGIGNLDIKNLDSLESISINYVGNTKNGFGIDFDTCPKLKDVYCYGSEWIIERNIKAVADNNVTVHMLRSNTSLQKYLTQYNVNYVYIDDEMIYGDANCDGEVNMADAVSIMQHISNPDKVQLTDLGIKFADVANTGDGLTNLDALEIQKYKLGLVETLD